VAGSSYDSLHYSILNDATTHPYTSLSSLPRSSSEERGGKPRCRYPPWLRVLAASFNPMALLQERENEQRSPGVSAKYDQYYW